MIYAQHHDPESVRCETILDGLVCGEPADYTRSRRFQDAGHTWWRHHPICERCTHLVRRAEIDRWLREIGARVIRVEDLGAALEARVMGGALVHLMTGAKDRNTRAGYVDRLTHLTAMTTASEARLALGHTD